MKHLDWSILLLWAGVFIFLFGIVLNNIPMFALGFAGQCLFYEWEARKEDSDCDNDSRN